MSGSRAFRQQVRVFVGQHLSPEAQSKALAASARSGRDQLIASGRAAPAFATYVDGQAEVSEDRVKPGGAIVYRFQVLGEAAAFAMAFLVRRSPMGRAKKTKPYPFAEHYRDQFVYALGARGTKGRSKVQAEMYIGNRIIRPDSFDPQRVDADVGEILIVNRSPYARKVDVQLIGSRKLVFSVPADLFDDAAAAVRRRFPTLDARRVYTMRFPGQYTIRQAQMRKGSQRFARRVGTPVENPALVISTR